MTLKRIEDHILEGARTEAAGLTAAAREEAERITTAAREEAEARYAEAVQALDRELKTTFEQETGRLRAECRTELLKLKSRILDDVFRHAADRLLHRDGYWRLIRTQLRELAGRQGQVLCRAEHHDAVAGIVDELNRELDGKLPPVATEPIDITGGFVFHGERFDIDCSLDSQLATFREKRLPELIAEAFPEE